MSGLEFVSTAFLMGIIGYTLGFRKACNNHRNNCKKN